MAVSHEKLGGLVELLDRLITEKISLHRYVGHETNPTWADNVVKNKLAVIGEIQAEFYDALKAVLDDKHDNL